MDNSESHPGIAQGGFLFVARKNGYKPIHDICSTEADI
jgi:hypothetical protein